MALTAAEQGCISYSIHLNWGALQCQREETEREREYQPQENKTNIAVKFCSLSLCVVGGFDCLALSVPLGWLLWVYFNKEMNMLLFFPSSLFMCLCCVSGRVRTTQHPQHTALIYACHLAAAAASSSASSSSSHTQTKVMRCKKDFLFFLLPPASSTFVSFVVRSFVMNKKVSQIIFLYKKKLPVHRKIIFPLLVGIWFFAAFFVVVAAIAVVSLHT